MTIIAKLHCNFVKRNVDHAGKYAAEEVSLNAVYGPENEPWSTATPEAHLTMTISNPGAQGQLTPGKKYLVTIEEAPE